MQPALFHRFPNDPEFFKTEASVVVTHDVNGTQPTKSTFFLAWMSVLGT